MITQPQTLYGIADSPVGLAAWMINHDAASYADIADAFAGHPVGNLTRDEVLDNVTFYWLTNTGISSARLYWENTFDFFGVKGVNIPAAVSVFPKEIYKAPRSWAERAYPKLIYFNEVDAGCHFAAWQEPTLFAASSAPRSGHCASRVQAVARTQVAAIRHARIAGREPGSDIQVTRRHRHERTLACARRAAHGLGPAARRG